MVQTCHYYRSRPIRSTMNLRVLTACLFTTQLAFGQSVVLQPVVSGLVNPVDIAHAGDARLFIVQRVGLIRILQPNGALDATPFLNITDRVNSAGGEQGLLGLAFDPDYTTNGHLYVNYIGGTGNGVTRISRFTVTADPDVADPASELILFSQTQPATNHNGGDLEFGPDGYLWFALGDGGGVGDPNNLAQNMLSAHGKMHRIDVSNGAPYGIPTDNPFATANPSVTLRSIWASGLRNPYRFSFDALTGDVWIGDVGQGAQEEVDRVPAGQHTGPNFGWRCYEGTAPYNTAGCAGAASYVAPIYQHLHSDGSCSLIGGFVYRGSAYPSLYGKYIYTDYCHGRIHALQPNGSGGWTSSTLMASGSFGLSGFGEDAAGELYVCNTSSGIISRIVDPAAVVRLDVSVLLDGPLNTSTMLMNDDLRLAGTIPLTEPYTALGYGQAAGGGGETTATTVLSTTGNNAIVDWVRLELRSVAEPRVVVATRQALVQRDGDIVKGNGNAFVEFGVGPGNYYVTVRHRNHLAAMTAAPIALSATVTVLDLSSAAVNTFGVEARRTVGSQRALWSGNVLVDDRLRYTGPSNDRDPILSAIGGTVPTSTATGYRVEDVNLDGVVRYTGSANDRDPILSNIGGLIPTNTRVEQLP
jgi:glucose/arabinose dehydrogenase